jgi:hypothetical protein
MSSSQPEKSLVDKRLHPRLPTVNKEIADKLAEADIILLLISDDFMAPPIARTSNFPPR